MMDSNSLINNMAAGLSHTSMANSLASSLANTNSMVSGFANTSMASGFANTSMASGFANTSMASGLGSTNSMGSAFAHLQLEEQDVYRFGLSRKSTSELSPGSRKAMTAGLPSTAGQNLQPPPPQQGQQAFNIQAITSKTRKPGGGFFGEEEDSETSMYFPGSSNLFRPDKDFPELSTFDRSAAEDFANIQMLNQSQSPSQPAGFANNFYTQGGLNSFSHPQQRGPVSGPQFQRSGIPQNSPNRGVITAIGQHRMINTSQANQAAMSSLQKRPIGSGLPSSSAGPITSFGFPTRSESGQPNFDLSDFPSLGNRVTPSSSMSAARNYVGMVNKNPVQDQTPEFQIQQEDFPALPGAQSTLSMFVSDPPTSANKDQTKQPPMNLLSGPSYEQALNKDGKPGSDKLGSSVRKGIQVHPDGRVTNIPPNMVPDQFGIVGLLTFIRSAETDPSLVALAPGLDLTTLGLNLNSPDSLYSTFQSPWVDLPCRPQDIDFHVPAEYLTNIYIREKLAPIKLNRYGEDLLFYLFYMNGGDVLQLAAAAELYNRDWRYHKEERVWITRAPGVEPVLKTNTYEKGTYYFFDVTNWRKVGKEFFLEYDKLEERPLLPTTLYHNPNQPTAAH